MEKIKALKGAGKREVVKTWKRASMVLPEMVGLTLAIHDGRRFISVFITENMVGHKLGEFVPTRTFRVHSGQRKAGMEGVASPTAGVPTAAATPTATTPAAPASGKK
jgi:small subunit ribosomal protein S19